MFEGDLALQVWLESCVPSSSRKTTLLCAVRVDGPNACVWLQHSSGPVVFRLECVSGSPRGLAKSHIAGSQSPVSPGWDLKTATSAGLWATLRTTLQTMASLTKTWLPSDCCALNLRGQWEWSGSKSTELEPEDQGSTLHPPSRELCDLRQASAPLCACSCLAGTRTQ